MKIRIGWLIKDRLGWLLAAISIFSVAGTILIAALAMGYYSWISFAVAGIVGVVFGWPFGIWSAKWIKRDDPNWPRSRRTRHS